MARRRGWPTAGAEGRSGRPRGARRLEEGGAASARGGWRGWLEEGGAASAVAGGGAAGGGRRRAAAAGHVRFGGGCWRCDDFFSLF